MKQYRKLYRQIDDVFDKIISLSNLPYYEFWSLYLINEGKTTQVEIMEALYSNKQTINSAIKNLVNKGLIELKGSEKDKRKKTCFLTEKGKEFYSKNVGLIDQIEEKSWNNLEKAEKEKIISSTNAFLDSLIKESKPLLEEGK